MKINFFWVICASLVLLSCQEDEAENYRDHLMKNSWWGTAADGSTEYLQLHFNSSDENSTMMDPRDWSNCAGLLAFNWTVTDAGVLTVQYYFHDELTVSCVEEKGLPGGGIETAIVTGDQFILNGTTWHK